MPDTQEWSASTPPTDPRCEVSRVREDWQATMTALLRGSPDERDLAFLKLNRLISGFLVALQAWDHHDHWEDLRQTVLMKLVKSFCRGQLREPKTFVAYARTITRNEFYDFLKRRPGFGTMDFPEPTNENPSDEATVLAVRSAVNDLPQDQRRAVHAVYMEGRTYREAAQVTSIPLGSLKRYLRLGLGQLRMQLAEIFRDK